MRFQSSSSGFLGWQVGGFYTHEDAISFVSFDPVFRTAGGPLPAAFGLPDLGSGTIRAKYEEVAGFGSATLNFTPLLSLTGGLRYSYLTLRTEQTLAGAFLGDSTNSGRSSSDKLTFSFNPVYRFATNAMLYGRIASGYRPGGPNITVSDPASYGPDSVVSYEVGTKGELFDRLLTYDLSGFLIDWSDIQVQQQRAVVEGGPPVSYIGNAGKARSKGVEAAFTLTPLEGLSLDANVAYTDAYFRNAVSVARPGERLPTSARWQGQVGGEYRFRLVDEWRAFLGVSLRHVGRRLSEFTADTATPRFVLPSYQTVDLRAGVEQGGLLISAYLRNATDERGLLGAFDTGSYATVSVIQPRNFGLSMAKTF